MTTKLEMEAERVEKIPMERAHRLPRFPGQKAGTPRNVMVKLSFWKDKDGIMSKARRIKPEGVFFMEDFSDTVRTARAKLKDLLVKAREAELKSYLSYNKLVVVDAENKRNVYAYDEDTDLVSALRTTFDDGLLRDHEQEQESISDRDDSSKSEDDK